MSGVSRIYQTLSGRRLFDIGTEEDREFAAPAEAGGADREGGRFAQSSEEVENAGFSYRYALVVHERNHVGDYAENRKAGKRGGLAKGYEGAEGGMMARRAYIL